MTGAWLDKGCKLSFIVATWWLAIGGLDEVEDGDDIATSGFESRNLAVGEILSDAVDVVSFLFTISELYGYVDNLGLNGSKPLKAMFPELLVIVSSPIISMSSSASSNCSSSSSSSSSKKIKNR